MLTVKKFYLSAVANELDRIKGERKSENNRMRENNSGSDRKADQEADKKRTDLKRMKTEFDEILKKL
eukprot:UN28552